MPLSSIQLCHIDRVNTVVDGTTWEVTAWSDDQQQCVRFRSDTEANALALRNAIRDFATSVRRVDDFNR